MIGGVTRVVVSRLSQAWRKEHKKMDVGLEIRHVLDGTKNSKNEVWISPN